MTEQTDAGGTTYTINNHGREAVKFPFWQGEAGVRRDGEDVEFAYIGEQPKRSPVGETGTIGENAVKLVSIARSRAVPAMMVGVARLVE